MKAPTIHLSCLYKSFGEHAVLRGVSFDVMPGQVVSIVGPSGSGKSTLLRCANLLEIPDTGCVQIEEMRCEFGAPPAPTETQMAALRARTGMVFQHFHLFPHMTALGNVIEAPILVKRVPRAEAIDRARDLLKKVGLEDKQDAYPIHLSGGQKQRVAIARALAMDPKVLLLDEITSALDPELIQEVLEVVRRLASQGMTMVIVTHEVAFARDVSNAIAFMADGKILAIGSPNEILRDSSQPKIRSFLSRYTANL